MNRLLTALHSTLHVDGTGAIAFVVGVLSLLGMGVLVCYAVKLCWGVIVNDVFSVDSNQKKKKVFFNWP